MRLATYGTLGPGRPNHHHVEMIPGIWTTGFVRGFLHDQGWGAGLGFPGIELRPDGDSIEVDILESDHLEQHLSRLDAFEGPGYRRVLTPVTTAAGPVDAFIYVLAHEMLDKAQK